MSDLTADLFVSLDGFASGVNEAAFFGYLGQELEKWVSDHLEQPQLLILGRVTYEALASISMSGTDEGSSRMTELPKLVFSSTLHEPLRWKNARLAKGPLASEIPALKERSTDTLRSIGSVSLVRSMMLLGLVDRLRLMIFPVVLGTEGREPIFAGYPRTTLELVGAKVLDSRLILAEYRPARSSNR